MNNDLSKSHVDPDGKILKDISEKAEIICPTCQGKGTIRNPKAKEHQFGYYQPKEIERINCRTCDGEGWVLTNINI